METEGGGVESMSEAAAVATVRQSGTVTNLSVNIYHQAEEICRNVSVWRDIIKHTPAAGAAVTGSPCEMLTWQIVRNTPAVCKSITKFVGKFFTKPFVTS